MSMAEKIIETLEFYRDASAQSRLDDGGERAAEILDALYPDGDEDDSSLETVVKFAEDIATGATIDEVDFAQVRVILQEFGD